MVSSVVCIFGILQPPPPVVYSGTACGEEGVDRGDVKPGQMSAGGAGLHVLEQLIMCYDPDHHFAETMMMTMMTAGVVVGPGWRSERVGRRVHGLSRVLQPRICRAVRSAGLTRSGRPFRLHFDRLGTRVTRVCVCLWGNRRPT